MLLALAPVAAADAAGPVAVPQAHRIAEMLAVMAQGQDAAFGKLIAPAASLDEKQPAATRVQAGNAWMVQEIDRVLAAFQGAPATQKIAAAKAAVAAVDRETSIDGASRTFQGTGPSLSILRQLAFVPAIGADPVGRVMNIISSFERSPKPDDNYYEYLDPRNLAGSRVADHAGSATSWTSAAQPSMTPNAPYALKKCRHIMVLGWYCNTALYTVRDLGMQDGSDAKVLLTVLHALPKGADSPEFTDDRAKNIVDGYTALYVLTRSGSLILVYSLGLQIKDASPSQTGRLNEGHKAEYRQLLTRLAADLGIAQLPW